MRSSSARICSGLVRVFVTCYTGPRSLSRSIGLDTLLAIQRTLYEGTGDSKYRSAVLLERMVDAGWLGKKSGKGFYDYDADGKVVG
jgi:3-hydroxyacyl-CoA dehydrogenase